MLVPKTNVNPNTWTECLKGEKALPAPFLTALTLSLPSQRQAEALPTRRMGQKSLLLSAVPASSPSGPRRNTHGTCSHHSTRQQEGAPHGNLGLIVGCKLQRGMEVLESVQRTSERQAKQSSLGRKELMGGGDSTSKNSPKVEGLILYKDERGLHGSFY